PADATAESRGPSHVMPAAQRLLDEHDLAAEKIPATGPGGRLLKEDVLRHIEETGAATTPARDKVGSDPDGREEEAVSMSPLRRRIAERLVQAQHNAALLTTFNEIDMSAVMDLRNRYRDGF